MAKQVNAAVAALAKTSERSVPPLTLKKLREMVTQVRDKEAEKAGLDERAKQLGAELNELKSKKMPDAFKNAGVSRIDIPAEGNHAAFEAKLRPYYHANIRADWPPEQQEKGFAWLRDEGFGDNIKTIITIELGKGTAAVVKAILASLKAIQKKFKKHEIRYSVQYGIPWNSLTKIVKEYVTERKITPPLDVLGATVGDVVEVKTIKQEK